MTKKRTLEQDLRLLAICFPEIDVSKLLPNREPKTTMIYELYQYSVYWSEEDEAYVARCGEFPSLSHLAPDPGAALDGIMALVLETVTYMLDCGEEIPQPGGNHR